MKQLIKALSSVCCFPWQKCYSLLWGETEERQEDEVKAEIKDYYDNAHEQASKECLELLISLSEQLKDFRASKSDEVDSKEEEEVTGFKF